MVATLIADVSYIVDVMQMYLLKNFLNLSKLKIATTTLCYGVIGNMVYTHLS